MKTKEQFRREIYDAINNRPYDWRKGQTAFNYIDENYGLARMVQFEYHIDCFYDDSMIEKFIDKCYEIYKIKYNEKD